MRLSYVQEFVVRAYNHTHKRHVGCYLLTPFLAELGCREAHFDQHFLQEPSAFVMPGLQPDRHIGGMQHGFIQAPVPHQWKAVVINGAVVTATVVRR